MSELQQAVDVDLAVVHAAHERVALEVLDLVEIERAGDEPLQRTAAAAADERHDAVGRVVAELGAEHLGHLAGRDEGTRDLLVVQRADLLERVRERVVPDVVQQRGAAHDETCIGLELLGVATLLEQAQRAAREMVRTERVLEARVSGAGVDEIRESELADVAQPLERTRVDQPERQRVDADVVPERIANDLVGHARKVSVVAGGY